MMDVDVGNQLTMHDIPSIEDIQQTLVNINDKPAEFLNSTDWLGALEVCHPLHHHHRSHFTPIFENINPIRKYCLIPDILRH